jgi:hypothetical protein
LKDRFQRSSPRRGVANQMPSRSQKQLEYHALAAYRLASKIYPEAAFSIRAAFAPPGLSTYRTRMEYFL